MKIRIGDEVYPFEGNTMLVSETRLVKKHTGMGLRQLQDGMQNGDPDALVAMLFLAKRRAGVAVRWQDFDEFDLASIDVEDDTADIDDEGEEPDPPEGVEPPPTTSTDGTTPTDVSEND